MNNIVPAITLHSSMQIGQWSIKDMLENNKYVDLISSKGAYEVSKSKGNIGTPVEPVAQSQFWRNKPDDKLDQLTCYSWNDHPYSMVSCSYKTNEIVFPCSIEENLIYIKRWIS